MLKRFRLEQSASGAEMIEDEHDGEWVAADRVQTEIDRLKRVLKIVADTLPFLGGNQMSVDSLMREIKTVQ